jgi:hypothetical protein
MQEVMMSFDCTNLDGFLEQYGDLLAAKARDTLDPLHVPGRDAASMPSLIRKPFDAQAHVVEAVAKQWKRAKSCLMVAEMGCGKTLMAEVACHAFLSRKAQPLEIEYSDKYGEGLEIIPVDPWTMKTVHESRCHQDDKKSKGNAKTFEWAGETWATNGGICNGVPGVTPAYQWDFACYRSMPAEAWKGQVSTFGDVYNVANNPTREAQMAKVRLGVLGLKGQVKGKPIVFHSPALFRSACPRAYRVVVVCPGQLVEKWTREIVNTVPGAIVYQVDNYAQILLKARKHGEYKDQRQHQEFLKAEYARCKGMEERGEKVSLLDHNNGLDNDFVNAPRCHTRHAAKRALGLYPMGPEYYIIGRDCLKLSCGWKPVYRTRKGMVGCYCPKCGQVLIKPGDKAEPAGPDWFVKNGRPTSRRKCTASVQGGDGVYRTCGEQLWQETDKPKKYSPARLIQKKLKGFFDVGIIDEAHEYKSGDSLQGDAIGAIAGSCKKIAALTGTLVGGYAWHVRTLLYRIGGAGSLIEEGLGWKDETEFNRRFGRIETKTTTSANAEADEKIKGYSQGRGGKKGSKTTSYVRPGIMPTLFKHLLGQSVFLSLDEVADDLPDYAETPVAIAMDDEQRKAYDAVDKALTACIKDLIKKGNRKMLGVMLNCLLCYPDYAYDWGEIGYWDDDENSLGDQKCWVHVVTPENLDPTPIRPKEKAAVGYALQQKALGRQTWVYVCYTDKRDCLARLERFMKEAGLRVAVMRASVPPKDRERWIEAHGKNHDVILSHPQLVQTGLDFFSPRGGHNYCSILFYQTGYNLFTVMQAARRAWRIGQTKPCEVGFLYYETSMQSRAMALMGKKMVAARAINGQFSSEGLAAMAGDDAGIEMELAKSLADSIPEDDKVRSWTKVSNRKKFSPAVVVESREEESSDWMGQFGIEEEAVAV